MQSVLKRIGFFLAAFLVTEVDAMNLYTYDLDSLVHMSSDIVEAKLVRNYKEKNLELTEARVISVYKGKSAKGQSISLVAMDFYRAPAADGFNTAPLKEGIEVFLFLAKAHSTFDYDIPKDAEIYCTVPSGLKWVKDNGVMGFRQYSNPGPYELEKTLFGGDDFHPTAAEFGVLIGMSLRKTDLWAKRFAAEPSSKDREWLLQLLYQRPRDLDFFDRDHFAELASSRLANLHDPKTLEWVLRNFRISRQCFGILYQGFGNPEGRDFLLQKIGDEKEPMENRVQYARALREAGPVYQSVVTSRGADSPRTSGRATDGNGNYLTRLAKLASDTAKEEKLCLALLQGISIVDKTNPEMVKDKDGAVNVLSQLHAQTQSEDIRFQIENMLSGFGGEAYEKLDQKCGLILSILKEGASGRIGKNKERVLPIEYTITVLEAQKVNQIFVVFLNLANHQKTKAPFAEPQVMAEGNSGSGSRSIRIPQDLPRGSYRVYLEFDQDDQVVSVGHSFVTDL